MLVTLACSAFAAATVILLAFPRTPVARALHRHLVERPAQFLLDLTWKKLGWLTLVSMLLPLLAIAGPEMLAVFAVLGGDAAAIELLIAVFAMSMAGGLAAGWRIVRAAPARMLRIVRAFRLGAKLRAPRKQVRRRQPPKDDSSGPEWSFA